MLNSDEIHNYQKIVETINTILIMNEELVLENGEAIKDKIAHIKTVEENLMVFATSTLERRVNNAT